jgi:hypothetical protein
VSAHWATGCLQLLLLLLLRMPTRHVMMCRVLLGSGMGPAPAAAPGAGTAAAAAVG